MSLETRLGGDISPLRQALNEAKHEVAQFNATVSEAGSASRGAAAGMDETTGVLTRLKAEAEAAGISLRQHLAESGRFAGQEGLELARRKAGEAAGAFRNLSTATDGMTPPLKQATGSLGSANFAVTAFSRGLSDAAFGPVAVANNLEQLVFGLTLTSKEAKAAGTTVTSALVGSLTGTGGLLLAVGAVSFAMSMWGNDIAEFIKGNEDAASSVDELTKAAEGFINLEGKGPSFEVDPQNIERALEVTNTISSAFERSIDTLQRAQTFVAGSAVAGAGVGLPGAQLQSLDPTDREKELLDIAIAGLEADRDDNTAVRERLEALKVEAEVRERIERAAKAAGLSDEQSAKAVLGESFTTPKVIEQVADLELSRFEAPTFDSNEIARHLFAMSPDLSGQQFGGPDREELQRLFGFDRGNELFAELDATTADLVADMETFDVGVRDLIDATTLADLAMRDLAAEGIYAFGAALDSVIQRLLRGEEVSAGDVAGSFLSSIISAGISIGATAAISAIPGIGPLAAAGGSALLGTAGGNAYQGLHNRPDTSAFTATMNHRIQIQGSDIYIALNETIRQNNLPALQGRRE